VILRSPELPCEIGRPVDDGGGWTCEAGDQWETPVIVDRGPGHVRCGNHPEEWRVYHESVAAVRACYAILEDIS
jgi:hypothetical protein